MNLFIWENLVCCIKYIVHKNVNVATQESEGHWSVQQCDKDAYAFPIYSYIFITFVTSNIC